LGDKIVVRKCIELGRIRVGRILLLYASLLATQCVFATQANQFQANDAESGVLDEQSLPELPTSSAVGNPLPASDDQWRYSIAFPMVWLPDINGKVRGDESVDFEIPFKDIVENLNFGLMFELYANRGSFGLVFRSNYMRVRDESSRSGILDTQIKTQLDMGVNDLLASFRVHEKVTLFTGIRNIHARMDLKIRSTRESEDLINKTIKITDSSMSDLLFGLNFDHWFNSRWGIMLSADMGVVGDNDRDFSTEFRALYRISDLNNIWFGYRFLNLGNDVVTDSKKYKIDMSQHGPTIGWAFTF
jgi:hypothetical protein